MGDQEIEIEARIELEKSGSRCASCSGMGGVVRDAMSAITLIKCKGHKGECVAVRGETCPKFIPLCPKMAQKYLPILARIMREEKAAAA